MKGLLLEKKERNNKLMLRKKTKNSVHVGKEKEFHCGSILNNIASQNCKFPSSLQVTWDVVLFYIVPVTGRILFVNCHGIPVSRPLSRYLSMWQSTLRYRFMPFPKVLVQTGNEQPKLEFGISWCFFVFFCFIYLGFYATSCSWYCGILKSWWIWFLSFSIITKH